MPHSDDRPAMQLMDSGLPTAARARATVRRDGHSAEFDLPVWVDLDGRLRLALPKSDPQHAGDCDQVIVGFDALLSAAGAALASARTRRADDAAPEPGQ